MRFWLRHLPYYRHDDPPEPWEYPLSREVAIYLCRRARFGHPFVPHRQRVLPAGAFRELRAYCGVRALEDLFVVPDNVRGSGDGRTLLRTPTQILGIGQEAVGLWVAGYEPAVPVVIPLEHIVAAVDLHQLLYGRVYLKSAAQTLTLRYNAVSNRALRQQLLRLRRLLWRRGSDHVTAEPGDQRGVELPRRWRLLASSTAVRLTRDAPASIHAENVWPIANRARRTRGREPEQANAQFAAVTQAELVVATEPDCFNGAYGLRLMHVPRGKIERVRLGEKPWIDTYGLELPLPVSPRLAVRIAEALTRDGKGEVVTD